jgi:tRNA G18 (ribose-2'-O)-methylase SpoU
VSAGAGETVTDPLDPRLLPLRDLQAGVRRRRAALGGRVPRAGPAADPVVVEGEIPVGRLLAAGWAADTILVTPAHREALAPLLDAAAARGARVLLADHALLRAVTGLRRDLGCYAVAPRPDFPAAPPAALLEALRARGRSTLVVAERVTDPTNLGALVRNARAFGADLLLADERGADPLDPRAVRTSAGQVFALPLCVPPDLPAAAAALRDALGGRLVAATTSPDAEPVERFRRPAHLLLALGFEGEGLSARLLAAADARVTVPLAGGVDSLNVAAASAVLLHALR